jgi:hypothetical protein
MIGRRSHAIAYDPPLDSGIRRYVEALNESGIETFESCEGGPGHAYPEPTIRFSGDLGVGFRALSIVQRHGFPVASLRRTWLIIDDEPTGPYWELTFWAPPRS